MKLINLTPHAISVRAADGAEIAVIPPSGQVARVAVETTPAGMAGDIPLYTQGAGEPVGLPAPLPDTILLVSALVRLALPGRADLASPGDLIRGADGQPVGCRGLVVNAPAAGAGRGA